MRLSLTLLAALLTAGLALAQTQPASPLSPLQATLDTVAVTGSTRVLTLAAAPTFHYARLRRARGWPCCTPRPVPRTSTT